MIHLADRERQRFVDSDHVFLFALNFFWEPSLSVAIFCYLTRVLRGDGNTKNTHRHAFIVTWVTLHSRIYLYFTIDKEVQYLIVLESQIHSFFPLLLIQSGSERVFLSISVFIWEARECTPDRSSKTFTQTLHSASNQPEEHVGGSWRACRKPRGT